MENLRYAADPVINDHVARVVEALKQELIARFHPRSIILAGSLGRGEATVATRNGAFELLSDAEVILIPNWSVLSRRKLRSFSDEFWREHGLKASISGIIPTLQLALPVIARGTRPTIDKYDLRYGSRVIYGADNLRRIGEMRPQDIPVWEGVRLLYNRMAEALEVFPGGPSTEMAYRLDKVVFACRDSLLLTSRRYDPSYESRNRLFCESFPQYPGSLRSSLADLPELSTQATARKLNRAPYQTKSFEQWSRIAEVCETTLRYVVALDTGVVASDWVTFQAEYLHYPGLKDYRRLPFGSSVAQNAWSGLRSMMTSGRPVSLSLARHPGVRWAHLVYSALPLLYFGRRRDEIEARYLARALDVVRLLEGKEQSIGNPLEAWEYARGRLVTHWQRLCW